ncbi:MAG: hypothetical protein M3Q19_05675 [Pseudomonadota bacterium]|nr:hypothetical protein [Pseudomonadota bacterium]
MSQPVVLDLDPIATFTHDLPVANPLYAYPPVPAEQLGQVEQLALHSFGSLLNGIRSPRHMYMGAWRDPDPRSGLPGGEAEPPTSLLLMVMCGIAPYESPSSLLDLANAFNTVDRARLRIDFVREGDAFRPSFVEVEVSGLALKSPFRSVWNGDEIGSLDADFEITAPASRYDAMRFAFRGTLPRRFNAGEELSDPVAHVRVEGRVDPLPRWVNY